MKLDVLKYYEESLTLDSYLKIKFSDNHPNFHFISFMVKGLKDPFVSFIEAPFKKFIICTKKFKQILSKKNV